MKKIMIILAVILLVGCTTQNADEISVEDAKKVAEERIKKDYNYEQYNGNNLRLVETNEKENGYKFRYHYDIENGPTNVNRIEISLLVNDGETKNYTHTEILSENNEDTEKYFVKYNNGTIEYNITVIKPTPCHEVIVDKQVSESDPVELRLDVQIRDSGKMCAQVTEKENIVDTVELGYQPGVVSIFIGGKEVYSKDYDFEITSFAECTTAGYEVLYPDCEGCLPYCETPSGERFEQQLPPKEESQGDEHCIDQCGDGVCDEVVCMAEGCPCAETPQNCPEDCS